MWWNISFLKFRAIPAEALAAFVPARIPNTRAIMDITKSTAPTLQDIADTSSAHPLINHQRHDAGHQNFHKHFQHHKNRAETEMAFYTPGLRPSKARTVF